MSDKIKISLILWLVIYNAVMTTFLVHDVLWLTRLVQDDSEEAK